jgi:hypothetical protein
MCIDTYWDWSVWYIYILYIYIIYPYIPMCCEFYRLSLLLLGRFARECRMHELSRPTVVELARNLELTRPSAGHQIKICCLGSTKTGKTGTTSLGRSLPSIPVDPSWQVLHRVVAVSTSFSHPGSWEFEQKHRKNNGTRIIWPIFLIISPTLVLLTPFLGVFNIFRSVWQPQNCQVFGTVQDGAPPVSGAPKKTCRHFLSRVKKNRNASLYDYGWDMDG